VIYLKLILEQLSLQVLLNGVVINDEYDQMVHGVMEIEDKIHSTLKSYEL
jgi:hypothetical protein